MQKISIFAFPKARDVAQLVSAPRSGRGGRVFESPHPDKKRKLVQLSLFY